MNKPIVIITPGPTLGVYQGGKLVVSVALSQREALFLAGSLIAEVKI